MFFLFNIIGSKMVKILKPNVSLPTDPFTPVGNLQHSIEFAVDHGENNGVSQNIIPWENNHAEHQGESCWEDLTLM